MKTGPRPCGFQLPPSRRVAGITSSCSAATNGTSGPRRRFNAGQLRAGLFTPSSCGGSQLLLNQRFQPIPGAINRHPAERPKRHVQSSWKSTVYTHRGEGNEAAATFLSRPDILYKPLLKASTAQKVPLWLLVYLLFTANRISKKTSPAVYAAADGAQGSTVPLCVSSILAVCNRNTVTTSGQ